MQGGRVVLAIPVQGDLEEGQLSLLATSDISKLQVLVGNFTLSVFGQIFFSR